MEIRIIVISSNDPSSRHVVEGVSHLVHSVDERIEIGSPSSHFLSANRIIVVGDKDISKSPDLEVRNVLASVSRSIEQGASPQVSLLQLDEAGSTAIDQYPYLKRHMKHEPIDLRIEGLFEGTNKLCYQLDIDPAVAPPPEEERRLEVKQGALDLISLLVERALSDTSPPQAHKTASRMLSTVSDATREQALTGIRFLERYMAPKDPKGKKKAQQALNDFLYKLTWYADRRYRTPLLRHFMAARYLAKATPFELLDAFCRPVRKERSHPLPTGEEVYARIIRAHPDLEKQHRGETIWIDLDHGEHVIGPGLVGADQLIQKVGRENIGRLYSRVIGEDVDFPSGWGINV